MSRAIKVVLFKLAFWLLIILVSVPLVFSNIAHELAVVLAAFVVILFIPVAISYCIDAHREIRADVEAKTQRKIKILGVILGIPQVLVGFVLMVSAIYAPINMLTGGTRDPIFYESYFFQLMMLFICACFLVIGYHYIKEGLGLGPSLKFSLSKRRRKKQQ